jgi:hypothetical protein
MSYLDHIEADVIAFKSSIAKIDQDFKDQTISPQFYYSRRNAFIRDYEITIKKLENLLQENGAPEIAEVLKDVRQDGNDDVVRSRLEHAAVAGKPKGWGDTIRNALSEHKGSIIGLAISVAVKVAKTLI